LTIALWHHWRTETGAKLKKQSSQNKSSGYVQKPVEKYTNTLENFIRHRKCRPGLKVCKNIYKRNVQIFWKVQKWICWFLGKLWSFFTCKISYLLYQTQKNLKLAVHFHICVLQHPIKLEAEVMRITKVIPMIQKISNKCPKIEEKLTKSWIKHLEKFRLFVIGCIFALFQCCTLKSSTDSNFGVKPKKSLFSNAPISFFCCNIVFPQP